AVDKDEAAGKTLAGAGVRDGMLEHGDPVVFARQGGVCLVAPALLDGQKARLLPVQVVGVRVIDILILMPSHGAQGVEAVAVQATDVIGAKRPCCLHVRHTDISTNCARTWRDGSGVPQTILPTYPSA